MKRPVEVSILGWLFIGVGALSLAYHLLRNPLDASTLPISLVGVIAVVSGVFLLKGRNWARWLLISWLAVHVFISALHSVSDSLAHAALLGVIAYVLVASPASAYFQSAK
jgi:uncharacterized membrane protein HdeD (DUF308 family)